MRRTVLALLLGLGTPLAFAVGVDVGTSAHITSTGGITSLTTPSFEYMDQDGSGGIDVVEADRLQDLSSNIDLFDLDGDGDVDEEEFAFAKQSLPEMYG